MGLFNRHKRDTEQVTEPQVSDVLLRALLAGDTIDRQKAMTLPAVSGAVDFISGAIASMPVYLYRVKKGNVERVDDVRSTMLNGDTGDTLDGFQLKKAMVEDYLLDKGGYCYIERSRNDVIGLYYVATNNVSININSDPIHKDYDILVGADIYKSFEFVKLLRNTKDGASGIGLTAEVSKALETAYQTLLYQLYLVKSGGNKKGFLKATRKLGQEEIDILKRAWANLYANNSENVVVLNNGLEFQEASNSSVEMQLNESKKTLESEINNIFHIKDNFEETYKFAIYPIVRAFETALNRDLLLESEKKKYFFAFDSKEIIKASLKERYETYQLAKDCGLMTINEMRQAENMNTIDGMDYINLGLDSVLYNTNTGEIYTPNTDSTKSAADAPSTDGQTTDESQQTDNVVDETMDKAQDVVRKPLLVGQMQSMGQIIAGVTNGTYTQSQAKNMLMVGVGLTSEEADKVLDVQQQTEEQANVDEQNRAVGTKTIAVDYDGTIAHNGYPKPEVVDKLKALQAQGDKLMLWTARTGKDRQDAIDKCKQAGLTFDGVLDRKPEADLFVDDKAATADDILDTGGAENED